MKRSDLSVYLNRSDGGIVQQTELEFLILNLDYLSGINETYYKTYDVRPDISLDHFQ